MTPERLGEIRKLVQMIDDAPARSWLDVNARLAIADLLVERDDLRDIIRIQIEASGDCRCMGCQRGRAAIAAGRGEREQT